MIDYRNTIRELRDKLCMTQKEFAEFLGVSSISIIRWEQGSSTPSMKLRKIIIDICKNENSKIKEV